MLNKHCLYNFLMGKLYIIDNNDKVVFTNIIVFNYFIFTEIKIINYWNN